MRKLADTSEFDPKALCVSKDTSFPMYNTTYITRSNHVVIENIPASSDGSTNIGSFISSMILHVLSISTIVQNNDTGDTWLENKGIDLLDIAKLLSSGMYHGFSISVVPEVLEEYNKDSFLSIFKLSDRIYMAVLKDKPNELIFIKSCKGAKKNELVPENDCKAIKA